MFCRISMLRPPHALVKPSRAASASASTISLTVDRTLALCKSATSLSPVVCSKALVRTSHGNPESERFEGRGMVEIDS